MQELTGMMCRGKKKAGVTPLGGNAGQSPLKGMLEADALRTDAAR